MHEPLNAITIRSAFCIKKGVKKNRKTKDHVRRSDRVYESIRGTPTKKNMGFKACRKGGEVSKGKKNSALEPPLTRCCIKVTVRRGGGKKTGGGGHCTVGAIRLYVREQTHH